MLHSSLLKSSLWCLGFILIAVMALSFDLGNPYLIRQGTESLYLAMAEEMHHAKAWMQPLYQGQIYWTKPPLHFWLSFPFFAFFPDSPLMASRFSMVVLAVLFILGVSAWFNRARESKFNLELSLFFLSSFGLLRFSRMYMMELPLMAFSVLAVLCYYASLEQKTWSKFFFAGIFLTGLSGLIKGPVSWAMIGGSAFFFHLAEWFFYKRPIPWKHLLSFGLLSFVIGSVWYVVNLIQHGQEFFDYFFIRENLGKFSSRSYPMISLFQGLFLYSLPWFLLLIPVLQTLKKTGLKNYFANSERLFLWISFAVFFMLWFIPKQRSVHYAFPAVPLFLLILYSEWKENSAWIRWPLALLNLMVVTVGILCLYFSFTLQTLSIVLLISVFALIFALKKRELYLLLNPFLQVSLLWIFLIPLFFFPLISPKAISLIKPEILQVATIRPYFFQQELQFPVPAIWRDDIPSALKRITPLQIILTQETLELLEQKNPNLKNDYQLMATWPKWKRRVHFADIIEALRTQDLHPLRDDYILIKNL